MDVEKKVNAWLVGKQSYAITPCPNTPAPALSPTDDNIFTPPAPSGHLFAIQNAKSIANLLHRAISKPNLRGPLQLKKTLSRNQASNRSLDPELTCRGLPEMMTRKEMTVTMDLAATGGSNAEQAQSTYEEVITHFPDSTIIARDRNVNVTKIKADANDESLQRYKKSLGLGGGKDLSDPNDSRVCIIQSLTMESSGRPPVTIDLSQAGSESTLKDKPFKIKEGAKFTMVASFRVQHEILSGLQYVQTVKRKGIRVSKDSEMLVSVIWRLMQRYTPSYSY